MYLVGCTWKEAKRVEEIEKSRRSKTGRNSSPPLSEKVRVGATGLHRDGGSSLRHVTRILDSESMGHADSSLGK